MERVEMEWEVLRLIFPSPTLFWLSWLISPLVLLVKFIYFLPSRVFLIFQFI